MKTRETSKVLAALVAAGWMATAGGCCPRESGPEAKAPKAAELPPPPRPALDQVPRAEVNQLAAELYLPLFWDRDRDEDGALDPDELVVLWQGGEPTKRADWVDEGGFTERFYQAYEAILARKLQGPSNEGIPAGDVARVELLRRELAQGRPTLLSAAVEVTTPEDRAIMEHVFAAAAIIERLYQKQMGSWRLRPELPVYEPVSRAVFLRNHGPWCLAPATEGDAKCNAIPSLPKKLAGVYPDSLQAKERFCDALAAEPDAAALRHQFNAVVERDGKLVAVPYHEIYADDMRQVAAELKAAAAAIESDGEAAFKRYLLAAAKAFEDGSWEQADEAWAKMNVHNSKWYLRIGPDEVYWDPCSLKAGFHVSFARINQDSLRWQNKLEPVKADMEAALAKLAGPPYQAREVSFHLPDFIDIVLNAGDARKPHGGTIGQSLPNWGPVANEGRGRTVMMTNLSSDPDSRTQGAELASTLLCAESMALYTSDPEPQVVATVLHEAAHNLGPAHEYQVGGKKDREVFGGPLASMLEELKAQTAALYFTDWLAARGIIDAKLARETHVRDVTWAFGHISRGMYTAEGKPRPYSQLAAIQLGWLLKEGAVTWHPERKAANDSDVGCFTIDSDAFAPVVERLMREVAGIKARGDKATAEKLIADFVDAASQKPLLDTIAERWLRAPRTSFVYRTDR